MEEGKRSVYDLPWESWVQILNYLPVESICDVALSCHFFFDRIHSDSMLWRDMLQRDFEYFEGGAGIDLLQQQENSLTLSQSIPHAEWAEAPWKEYYILNYNASKLNSLCWVTSFHANMEERQDHACARCGDYLVVYAGFTGDRSLYVLDTGLQVERLKNCIKDSTNTIANAKLKWHICDIGGKDPNFMGMLYGHTLVALDSSTLLLYGGMQAPGYRFENGDVWLLHLEKLDNSMEIDGESSNKVPFSWKWSKPSITGNIPPARAYHSAVVADGKFWIFGGTWNTRTHNDLWCLDLNKWEWSEIEGSGMKPSDRMGHSCTRYGNELFILGGTNSPYCQGYDEDFIDGFAYNFKTNSWRSLVNCPGNYIGRRHASSLVGDCILVIAGGSPHTNGVALFNLKTETWMVPNIKGQPPSKRVSLSAHYCNGLVFVFGGCTTFGLSRELFILDPCDFIGTIKYERIATSTNVESDDEYFGYSDAFRNIINRQNLFQLLMNIGGMSDDEDDMSDEEY